MEKTKSAIGLNIRLAREKAGWSVRKLSRESGVLAETISSVERGHQQDIGINKAGAIAHALGVTLDALLAGNVEICPTCNGIGIIQIDGGEHG